jgi:hypothetical protein
MASPAKRVIVKFKMTPELSANALGQLCDAVARVTNGRLVRPPSATGRAVFQMDSASDLNHLMAEIRKWPSVQYVEPDVIDRSANK